MARKEHKYPAEVDVFEVPVRSVLRVFGNPMKTHAWQCEPFSSRDVRAYIKHGLFDDRPWDGAPGLMLRDSIQGSDEGTREYHIARIAYMVVNPQPHPICLEMAMPHLGVYLDDLYDGNHRFAAAIVRRDKTIRVTFGGGVDRFFSTFRSAKGIMQCL